MEITGAWSLLGMVGLLVTVRGQVPTEELSDIQTKALTLVTEDFHNVDNIYSRFQVTSVLNAAEEKFPGGIFVLLHLRKKQTNCAKTEWKSKVCKAMRGGRVFNCFACLKFEYGSHKVLAKAIDCVPDRQVSPEVEQKRRQRCTTMESVNETGLRLPGALSFVKSQ
ncbi:hypothetical protein XENTR_v10015677 [Xenopus tropicalis]|uniref:Retinoic acid receptor responder protein 2 n=1 Tax=Xenopus tropicalis TaxID=8364 RepID=A0A1B8Y3D5_XENTR|nr:retinoic acid receptor responder protein 2 [Xenopus tropicalis]KAE8595286.1 hypothetical protein XENTR_v10015677 [Xenopus tropicalis]|eukprot:XP_017945454.1 PREDICTED: retinoic acid receptor responder protein 2 [Xenopus tropicalis]